MKHEHTVAPDCGCRVFNIVRHYFDYAPRRIKRGLTLAEAQAHCRDPETSSTTATKPGAKARTTRLGAWFDGYEEQRERRKA